MPNSAVIPTVGRTQATPTLYNNVVKDANRLISSTGAALTIASGVITVTQANSHFTVANEAASALDDLTTINGGQEGEMISLIMASSSQAAVLKNGTGNIKTPDALDLYLTDNSTVILRYSGSYWYVDTPHTNNLRVPGGRLTLTSGNPGYVNVASAGTVYYTPYLSNIISLYNGRCWNDYVFSELSLTISTLTGTMYDIFAYDNGGTVTLTAVAWASSTARAASLVYQDGYLVRSSSYKNYLYLGSFYLIISNGTNSLTADSITKRCLWNYYNRIEKLLTVSENTQHSYSSTLRPWNNSSTNNNLVFVVGVSEDLIHVNMFTSQSNATSGNRSDTFVLLDDTTIVSNYGGRSSVTVKQTVSCSFLITALGAHSLSVYEISQDGTSATFYNMALNAVLRG